MWKVLALLALLTVSPAVAQERRPVVAVTISGLLPLVAPIAGEDVTVITILPSGVDAHHYTIQPDVVEKVVNADLIVLTGHIPWELELVDAVARERGVPISSIALDLAHDADVRLLKEPGSGEPNLHAFWLLPDNAKLIAFKLADRLSELRPEFAERFRTRAERLAREVDGLMERAHTIAGSKVVIAFFAEQYVVASFGLEPAIVLMKEGGISPKALEEARRGLLNGTLKGIVYSEVAEGFPQLLGQIRALAEETNAPTYGIRVFGIEGVEDYAALMAYNLGSLSSISTHVSSEFQSGFYMYLSLLIGIFAAAEAVVIVFLHRRLSER